MIKLPELKHLTGSEYSTADRQAMWEQLFLNFETVQQEHRKFVGRLKKLGVEKWDKELRVVELFCGRGGGLLAWESLGFKNIEGVDVSAKLVKHYSGKAKCHVADVRCLPFADKSFDVVCVQGGLHHLDLADDFDKALREIHRILVASGRFVLVEPWQSMYLEFVHFMMSIDFVRKLSKRIETYAILCALERETFKAWLSQSEMIIEKLRLYNEVLTLRIGWGKLMLVGARKNDIA